MRSRLEYSSRFWIKFKSVEFFLCASTQRVFLALWRPQHEIRIQALSVLSIPYFVIGISHIGSTTEMKIKSTCSQVRVYIFTCNSIVRKSVFVLISWFPGYFKYETNNKYKHIPGEVCRFDGKELVASINQHQVNSSLPVSFNSAFGKREFPCFTKGKSTMKWTLSVNVISSLGTVGILWIVYNVGTVRSRYNGPSVQRTSRYNRFFPRPANVISLQMAFIMAIMGFSVGSHRYHRLSIVYCGNNVGITVRTLWKYCGCNVEILLV